MGRREIQIDTKYVYNNIANSSPTTYPLPGEGYFKYVMWSGGGVQMTISTSTGVAVGGSFFIKITK